MDIDPVRRVGMAAAYQGGEVLRRFLGKIPHANKKGAIDLVTAADIESERTIMKKIRSTFPDHAILAEESGLDVGEDSDFQWIIDPLDGTTNFTHGLEAFAVSIAFSYRKKLLFGVVLNPVSGELYSAVQGQGAELNARPIRVSDEDDISESLLVTGFPYDLKRILELLMVRFSNCLQASQGVRRLGSAALDLCYLACGRFDGFWEQNLKPWDTAAGSLIASEAGAVITDFSGQPFTIDKKEILATNGKIHKQMLSLLEKGVG